MKTSSIPWRSLWGRISATGKLSFFSALLAGFVTHLYVFTNLLLNHDSTLFLYNNNDVTESGRWALKWLSSLSTYYQMPVVIGLISILALALCAAFTVNVLELSHPVCVILASGLIVSYPSVACIFSYLFTADAYFIALCLNAVGVWLTQKYRWGWVPCILLLALAMGAYQSFICYAVGLFLMDCILGLYSEKPVREVLAQGVKYLLILAASVVVYYAAMRFFLAYRHVQITSYQGLDELGTVGLRDYLALIPEAVRAFLRHFWSTPYLSPFFQKVQRAVCLLFIACGGYLWFARKLYRDIVRTLLLAVGFLLIPLALNFISVIMVHGSKTMLVFYSFVLFNVFFLKLAEMTMRDLCSKENRAIPAARVSELAALGLGAVLLWSNFCVCNEAYLRLQIRYENTFALSNRVAARIESLEGYSPELPLLFAGYASAAAGGTASGLSSHTEGMAGTDNSILYFNTHYAYAYFRDYLGLHSPKANGEMIQRVEDAGILNEMPSYPAEGSIRIWDGIIIVKFSDGKIGW